MSHSSMGKLCRTRGCPETNDRTGREETDVERKFGRHNDALHERLPFSTIKFSHSLSAIFLKIVYNPKDYRLVEGNGAF